MAKHTQGEWMIEFDEDVGEVEILCLRPGAELRTMIATVNMFRPDEEAKANASVLVAAPKLLAALKELFGTAKNEMVARGLPLEWQPDCAMERARLAIEEAEAE